MSKQIPGDMATITGEVDTASVSPAVPDRATEAPSAIASKKRPYAACGTLVCRAVTWLTTPLRTAPRSTVATTAAVALLGSIVIPVLLERPTTITDISVPKSFEDTGFTSAVCAERLRDALSMTIAAATVVPPSSAWASSTGSRYLSAPGRLASRIDLEDDQPNFTVPMIGLSSESLVSLVAALIHAHRISGEIIRTSASELSLTLREDGIPIGTPVTARTPDELLHAGALAILEREEPAIVVAALGRTSPAQAMQRAAAYLATADRSAIDAARIYVARANILVDTEHPDRDHTDAAAERDYHNAVAADPTYGAAYNGLGNLLRIEQKTSEAAEAYNEAIRLDAKDADPYNGLGNVYLDEGNRARASDEYRRAIRIDDSYADAHYNLGNVYRDELRGDDAVREYRRAVGVCPRFTYALVNLGNELLALGNRAEAERTYREAIRIDTHFAAGYFNLANIESDAGRRDDAIADYRSALADDPNDSAIHDNLGNQYFEIGRFDEATSEYRRAILLDAKNGDAHYNLANVFATRKSLTPAIEEYRRAIRLGDRYAPAYNNLGNALLEKGDRRDAQIAYRQAIGIDSGDVEAHVNLANILTTDGHKAEAESEYRTALRLRPGYRPALENLEHLQKTS